MFLIVMLKKVDYTLFHKFLGAVNLAVYHLQLSWCWLNGGGGGGVD